MELDRSTAGRVLSGGYFNLIRRGADGSLVLSADVWRLERATPEGLHFAARDAAAQPLDLALAEVEQMTWDRLPRQRVRSQVRFHLRGGDVWTFSGSVDERALEPPREDSG